MPHEHTKINLCSKKSKYIKANDYLRKDSESNNWKNADFSKKNKFGRMTYFSSYKP